MKKALQITVAGILFTIEEDGYQKLQTYLSSIEQYFSAFPDRGDVVQDIEARVAEQLIERLGDQKAIVTLIVVDQVIAAMGSVEEITGAGSGENVTDSTSAATKNHRKLYRSSDDVVIAGVASGLAAYFSIDPLIVRIIFVILVPMTSGGMILIYLLLALFIPKAQTAADKITMYGGPVTLASFRENISQQAEVVKKNGKDILGRGSRLRQIIESLFHFGGRIVRFGIRAISGIAGLGFLVGGLAGIAGALFAFINLSFNIHTPYVDFPIAEVLTGPLYYLLVSSAFVLVLIPLVFLLGLGRFLLTWKRPMGSYAAMGLLGAWLVIVLIAGSVAIRVGPETRAKVMALPQYQVVDKTENLKDFKKLELHGVDLVKLKKGDTFSVLEHGRAIDVERTQFEIKEGTLILTQRSRDVMCFFCLGRNDVEITITMPEVEKISAHGAVTVQADTLKQDSLEIVTTGSADIKVPVQVQSLSVQMSGSSSATISGVATTLKLMMSGASDFAGQDLVVTETIIETEGSSDAVLQAKDTLSVKASGASTVTYFGQPKIKQNLSGAADIVSGEATTTEDNL